MMLSFTGCRLATFSPVAASCLRHCLLAIKTTDLPKLLSIVFVDALRACLHGLSNIICANSLVLTAGT